MRVLCSLIFILSLGSISLAGARSSDSREMEEIIGVDENKNGVKDEVEDYIREKISKNPRIFQAYLLHAQSETNILRFYPSIEKVKANEDLRHDDSLCVILVDSKNKNASRDKAIITELIFASPKAKKIASWYANNNNKNFSKARRVRRGITQKDVCRF